MSWFEAAARWYAVLAAITWALAPAIRWLCHRLDDRGVTLARPLAVLFAVYPAWLIASLGVATFSARLVTLTLILAGGLSWVVMIRGNGFDRRWLRDLALVEVASAMLFAAYLWLRGHTPQILGTEKPMDIAFLASSARAVTMPPLDPWFAGEPINYYYLGYLLHGTVGRLAAVSPETGFNLALATIFSTTAVAAFGVTWNVARPWSGRTLAAISGFLAAFAVVLSGNLYAPWRLLHDAPATISAWWWDSAIGIGWRSSRIVCDGSRVDNQCPFPATETINEFPYFSFLLGDLHPHVMALPYTLVAIGLAWNLARSWPEAGPRDRSWWVRVAVVGGVVGSLYPLNAWDFPTYVLFVAVAVCVAARAARTAIWKPIALLGAASMVAWLPFLQTYATPVSADAAPLPTFLADLPAVATAVSAVGLHLGERTSLGEYLTMFGVPYAVGLALVVTGFSREPESRRPSDVRMVVIAGAATMLPGVLLSAPIIPLCGIPLTLALGQLQRNPSASPRPCALLLFSFAWALSIGVELIYIRDVFDDRMNTLFKVYYQSWTMYAVAAAVTVAIFWKAAAGVRWRRALLAAGTIAAVVAGSAYPAVASWQWTEGFASWRGLDGLAFGEETDPDHVAAIRWLALRAQPGDVLLEAAGCSYYPFGRLPFNSVSAFTGIPSVIGWENHERQWRAGQPARIADIDRRQSDVARMYADPESPLIAEYSVTWLFIGSYETGNWQSDCETAGPYDGVKSPAFPGPGWEDAFQSGNTRLYRRLPR